MSDDELKLTRRFFLQQTAMTTAMTGGIVGMVLKTDALSDSPATPFALRGDVDPGMPYPYL